MAVMKHGDWIIAPVTPAEARRVLSGLRRLSWQEIESLAAQNSEGSVPDFLAHLAVRAEMGIWNTGVKDSDPNLRATLESLLTATLQAPLADSEVKEAVAFFWETISEGGDATGDGQRAEVLRSVLRRTALAPTDAFSIEVLERSLRVLG